VTKEELLRAMMLLDDSRARLLSVVEQLNGAATNNAALAIQIGATLGFTRDCLREFRALGLVTVEIKPRGLVVRTHLPDTAPPLLPLVAGESRRTDLPAAANSSAVAASAADLVAAQLDGTAAPTATDLPLPFVPDPEEITDLIAAVRSELDTWESCRRTLTDPAHRALKLTITEVQLRGLIYTYRDKVDLRARSIAFILWLSKANPKAKKKTAERSAADVLTRIAKSEQSWQSALEYHFGGKKRHWQRPPTLPAPQAPTVDLKNQRQHFETLSPEDRQRHLARSMANRDQLSRGDPTSLVWQHWNVEQQAWALAWKERQP
jgi:hypothetical protein